MFEREPQPGPITNTPLVIPTSDPEDSQGDLITKEAWVKLVGWYSGGPCFPCEIVRFG